MEQVDMKSQFGDCNPAAVDFLEKLIQFDPDKRMTVEQALAHPYLESYHVESVEPNHSSPLNFSFERENDLDNLRILISDAIVTIINYRASLGEMFRNIVYLLCSF